METELIKDRSLSSCIKTANNLLGVNFAKTIKGTWLPALLIAIMTAILGFSILQSLHSFSPTAPEYDLFPMVLGIVSWLGSIALWAYFFASVVNLVSESSFKQNLRRSFAITAVELIFYLVMMAIGGVIIRMVVMSYINKPLTPSFFTLVGGISLAWILLTALLMVPFRYAEMRYLLSPTGSLRRNLIAYYVSGVRGSGLLIGSSFFTALASICLGLVIFLPTIILLGAKTSSLIGELTLNDPSGLPTYFNALFIGSLILTTFIFMMVMVWTLFVFYYAYGSIEHRRQMKKQRQAATAE